MGTFLLVHGGWHGGWCWKKVTPLLRARGHEVFTPTLTGLGERSHLAHPMIGLETHIQDIVNVLEYEDLNGVILTPPGRTTVPAAVKNIGSAPAPATQAQVEDPNRIDALRIAEADVPALNPGAVATVNLVLNYVVSGNVNLAVLVLIVDPKNEISECREDNNRRTVGAP